jgi:hypothetical protein
MRTKTERAAPASTGNGSEIDPHDNVIGSDAIPHVAQTQDRRPVYLDGVLIGFVIAAPTGCEVITAVGAQLGRFGTSVAAARAFATQAMRGCCDGR